MQKFFLRLKLWKIFVTLMVWSIGLTVLKFTSIVSSATYNILSPLSMLTGMILILGWIWTVGTYLRRRSNCNMIVFSTAFHAGLVVTFCYLTVSQGYSMYTSVPLLSSEWLGFAIVGHLLSMLSMIVAIIYLGTTLVKAENKGVPTDRDYTIAVIQAWFMILPYFTRRVQAVVESEEPESIAR